MSRSERDKGASGEREVAAIFRAAGFDCDRVPNSGALRIKGDLYGTVPAHIESKRQERLQLWQWLAQAESEAPPGVMPVVAFRRSRAQWYATLPLTELAALMAVAVAARAFTQDDALDRDRIRAAYLALDMAVKRLYPEAV